MSDDPKGYPRPTLQRQQWHSLNGRWEFAIDADARWQAPADARWDRTIAVPFAPETERSGIGETGYYRACWYRRTFEAPPLDAGDRLLLHFGAVDYDARVWVNGQRAIDHAGGYTPFSAEITALLRAGGPQEVVLRAGDDPYDLSQPRGKQDWQREPHAIWYPRTTGIWQTVWMERVGRASVERLRWTPDAGRWEIGLEATIAGAEEAGLRLRVVLRARGRLIADDAYAVTGREVTRRIALADPGIDDARAELLWSPGRPTLIDAELELIDASGAVVDALRSYTALRTAGVEGDRFVLNGRPYRLRMVLDQGYWPESGLTAPSDEALRRDVELAKEMGFNGVRKHQKIEDPRYLYWADRLGLLVWEEMPSAYRFARDAVGRLVREWMDVIARDAGHPCIVAWVPFNESWGVPDLPASAAQRAYVRAVYELTTALDPTRPVIGNDGWEHVAADVVGIHDYDADPGALARRYASREAIAELIAQGRPGRRMLTVGGFDAAGKPVMVSECGGIGFAADAANTWGYVRASSAEDLAARYEALMRALRGTPALAGFCYTQFADTYQEANGLLYADRRAKFDLGRMRAATRGRA